jgi:hypothetical protein
MAPLPSRRFLFRDRFLAQRDLRPRFAHPDLAL